MPGRRSVLILACLLTLLGGSTARADFDGNGNGDLLGIGNGGDLRLYSGNGAGGFGPPGGQPVSGGWSQFTAVLSPGDMDSDGTADLLVRNQAGQLLLVRGAGTGGLAQTAPVVLGAGWQQHDLFMTPGDFTGDGKPDLLARRPGTQNGQLVLYRGLGNGRFEPGSGSVIGINWNQFTAMVSPGDFTGDGAADAFVRTENGDLHLFRGDGDGGFESGDTLIGRGWQQFDTLLGGNVDADGHPDLLGRTTAGDLRLYSGNGDGGFLPGNGPVVGSGWQSAGRLVLVGGSVVATPPTSTPAPPSGQVQLQTGLRCTPPGGMIRVSLRVRKPPGKAKARVRRIVFYIKGGQRKVDRKAPYRVRLRATTTSSAPLRVYARVDYKRPGSKRLRHRRVSKRYTICA